MTDGANPAGLISTRASAPDSLESFRPLHRPACTPSAQPRTSGRNGSAVSGPAVFEANLLDDAFHRV